MKKYLYLIFMLCVACTNDDNDLQDVVRFNPDDKEFISEPQDIFSSMQVIPLHCSDDIIVNTEDNVLYDENKFYIVDAQNRRRVDIFNSDGTYLSSVASRGRSGNEYIGINSAQLVDELIAIYSYQNRAIYYYNADGTFAKKEALDCAPSNLAIDTDSFWGYMGFSNGKMPERVIKIDKDGQITAKYMPSSAAIISMSERDAVFTRCDSMVLVRESLQREIQAIDKQNKVQSFLKFDFGKYNIPSEYFNQTDPYAAAKHLLESDFATIDRFYLNKEHTVVTVNFQFGSQAGRTVSTIGVLNNQTWGWLKAEEKGPLSLFFQSVRGLTPDSKLILLVEKEPLSEFAAQYPELIGDFDVSGDKSYIILCKLK